VEFLPVVKVIEVDGVFAGVGVIGNAIGAENRLPGVVVVNVAPNRGIEFFDRPAIQFRAVLFDPRLELRVSGLAVFDD